MAKPRVFLSSTCYDLHELRSQIRSFINNYGYDPVLSEFGDIFFGYDRHVQDACLKEIERCQMFVLVIGDTFGNTYYKDVSQVTPRSVTMAEFKKALSINIPKHIFINKYVEYDYKNYNRAWTKHIRNLQSKGNLSSSDNEMKVAKDKFNNSYSFNHDSYKHLFSFIESIYQVEGINVSTFEYSDDIKTCLTQQWAGAMYEYLIAESNVSKAYIEEISQKIDKMNDALVDLTKTKKNIEGDNNRLSFDLSKVEIYGEWSDIEKIKKDVYGKLNKILFYSKPELGPVMYYDITFTSEDVKAWIKGMADNLVVYKWQPFLTPAEIFSTVSGKFVYYRDTKIQVEDVLIFCSIMQATQERLSFEEYEALLKAIAKCFNSLQRGEDLPF